MTCATARVNHETAERDFMLTNARVDLQFANDQARRARDRVMRIVS